ncbi:Rpn family recombination-promoting nuclease/putative transposase [Myxococcota bacterium]|nr:Rpn family recombination-promoting nuclease/putative transposase [Myxococcota bacterium]
MTDRTIPPSDSIPAPPKGGKYIDFFTDFGFKKLFGPPHRERLMNFLNSLLTDLPGPIVDLEYLQQEQLGNSEDDRDAFFDLYCKTRSGERFIVEMQNSRQQQI